MYCTQDCICSLCRELRGFKLSKLHQQQQQEQLSNRNKNADNAKNEGRGGGGGVGGNKDNNKKKTNTKETFSSSSQLNDNFILKRRLSDINEPETNYRNNINSSNINKNKNLDNYKDCKINEKKIFSIKKAQSYNEINKQGVSSSISSTAAAGTPTDANSGKPIKRFYNNNGKKMIRSTMNLTEIEKAERVNQEQPAHKTVIYFGDSILQQRGQKQQQPQQRHENSQRSENADIYHAKLLLEETGMLKRQNSTRIRRTKDNNPNRQKLLNEGSGDTASGDDFMKQLKSVLEEKQKIIENSKDYEANVIPDEVKQTAKKDDIQTNDDKGVGAGDNNELPSYIDSIINGVINIKIEGNYETATRIIKSVTDKSRNDVNAGGNVKVATANGNDGDDDEEEKEEDADNFDWSFVQEWRARYIHSFILINIPFLPISSEISHQ